MRTRRADRSWSSAPWPSTRSRRRAAAPTDVLGGVGDVLRGGGELLRAGAAGRRRSATTSRRPSASTWASRGIDLTGLEVRPGPHVPLDGPLPRGHEHARHAAPRAGRVRRLRARRCRRAIATSPFVFLANIDPTPADRRARAVRDARAWSACDTMNHWIDDARAPLETLLPRVDLLIINDEEARLLPASATSSRAARRILAMGPTQRADQARRVRRASCSRPTPCSRCRRIPLEEVFDPTGAGDTFAGGVIGYLAATGDGRRAAACAGPSSTARVLASFVVEDFGRARLRTPHARRHRAALSPVRRADRVSTYA